MTTINLILSAVIWFEVAVVLGVTMIFAVDLHYGKQLNRDYRQERIALERLYAMVLMPICAVIGLVLYMVKDYVLTTPILTLIQGAFMAFIYYDFGPQARKSS